MARRFDAVADVSDWPRFHPTHEHPLWWGILALMAIEATVAGSLIASYFYLRLVSPVWPPGGVGPPPLLLPTVDLVLLALSAVAMWWSTVAVARRQHGRTVLALALAIALDSVVLVLRWQQFQALPFQWKDHAYGSLVWTLTGFHFLHVTSAVLGTAVVLLLAIVRYWTPERQIGSTVDAMYWYFVSALWVPIYLTLYWAPRALG